MSGRFSSQHGISMIELLVAMAVAAFLMIGVVQIYVNTLTNSELLGHMSALQEKSRFAIDYMSTDIRGAGYNGCTSEPDPKILLSKTDTSATPTFKPFNGISGWDAPAAYAPIISGTGGTAVQAVSGTWLSSSSSPVTIESSVMSVPGSDVLRIWGGTSNSAEIDAVTSSAITLSSTGSFTANEYIFVSNCTTVLLMKACTGTTASSVNISCNSSTDLPTGLDGGRVYSLRATTYFVGKLSNSATAVPALFRDAGDGTGPQELVRGVESMQVLYGVDLNQDDATRVDGWVTAPNVANWARVKAVRLSFVIQSEADNVVSSAQSFSFNGSPVTPTDKRLRRVFTQTINIRNRMYGGAYDGT